MFLNMYRSMFKHFFFKFTGLFWQFGKRNVHISTPVSDMTSSFFKRVEKHSQYSDGSVLGYLVGNVSQNKVYITGCVACRSSTESSNTEYPGIPNWEIEYEELASTIPTGSYGRTLKRVWQGVLWIHLLWLVSKSFYDNSLYSMLQSVQLCSCEPKL